MAAKFPIAKEGGPVGDMTDCVLCKQTVEDPRMLDCFHTFCLKCLTNYGRGKSGGDNINCPLCSKVFKIPPGGLNATPINDFASKLVRVEKYHSNRNGLGEDAGKVICDLCLSADLKEAAAGYCVDCCENMCNNCIKRHNKARATSAHNICTLDEKPPAEELLKTIPNDCSAHANNALDFYCNDCKVTACSICIRAGDHKDHNCTDNKTAAEELSKKSYQDVAKWSCFRKETEEFVKRIDTTLGEFREQVTKARCAESERYEEIKSLLAKNHEELIQNLDTIENNRKRELEKMRDKGKQEMLMLESLERHWNEVKARGSDCDVVQAAISLQNRTEQIVKQHEEQLSEERVNCSDKYYHRVEYKVDNTFTMSGNKNILGVIEQKLKDWHRLLKNQVQSFTSAGSLLLFDVAIHNNEVYMASHNTPHILVYSLQNLSTVSRQISVPGLTEARALIYNESDSCLYVSNYTRPAYIHKINTRNNFVTGWATRYGEPAGLSISKQKNLLVSYWNCGQIDEFNGSGQLIRSIKLSDGVTGIYHSIELETGEFIVCQIGPLHRICLVNFSGKVIKSYGKEAGSGVGQFNYPRRVELDQKGNILVSDYDNHKLRVLTSDLKYVADVSISDKQFYRPTSTCWDKENDRLLVTTESNRVCVITPQIV